MKYVSTGASATLPQLAVAEFVAKGYYERIKSKLKGLSPVQYRIQALSA